jgi:predicted nuclease of predicted toxin-antitoxin system
LKILLDECLDRRLARELPGHEVAATHQKGWAGIENGELLRLAEKEFDVFLTVDRNLSF